MPPLLNPTASDGGTETPKIVTSAVAPYTWTGDDEHNGKDLNTRVVERPRPIGRELVEVMMFFSHYTVGDVVRQLRRMEKMGQLTSPEVLPLILHQVIYHVECCDRWDSEEMVEYRRRLDAAAQKAGYRDYEEYDLSDDAPDAGVVEVYEGDGEPLQNARVSRLLRECGEEELAAMYDAAPSACQAIANSCYNGFAADRSVISLDYAPETGYMLRPNRSKFNYRSVVPEEEQG